MIAILKRQVAAAIEARKQANAHEERRQAGGELRSSQTLEAENLFNEMLQHMSTDDRSGLRLRKYVDDILKYPAQRIVHITFDKDTECITARHLATKRSVDVSRFVEIWEGLYPWILNPINRTTEKLLMRHPERLTRITEEQVGTLLNIASIYHEGRWRTTVYQGRPVGFAALDEVARQTLQG